MRNAATRRGNNLLMRYSIALEQAVAEWNVRCVTRHVDPPIKVDGWGQPGDLRIWLLAEDGWWGLVAGRHGVRWMRRRSAALSARHVGRCKLAWPRTPTVR